MRTEMFIKSYYAAADIAKHRICIAGSADNIAAVATSATGASIGVADSLGGKAGKPMDVIVSGYATVEYGGNVTRGQPLTSDSVGRAIAATVAGSRVIGFATASGASGDLGTVNLAPCFLALAP